MRAASDAEVEEPAGERTDLLLELPIGYARALKDEGRALGMARRHLIQQPTQRAALW
jgi:hypothetical protein